MRKLVKIGLVVLGIRALLRWWRSRNAATTTAPAVEHATDPADELRRKLAESRDDETTDEVSEEPAAAVADRRAEVHEQGRAVLDEMKSSDES